MAYDIEYLAMRVYIGIWLVVIALIVSFFEGSVFVKVFTRFTEELFAALICIIYIVESVVKLFKVSETRARVSSVDTLVGNACSISLVVSHTDQGTFCFVNFLLGIPLK